MTDQDNRTVRFIYNGASKLTGIEVEGIGAIRVTYNDAGNIDTNRVYDGAGDLEKTDSDKGRSVALQVTLVFQELMALIRPAGVALQF